MPPKSKGAEAVDVCAKCHYLVLCRGRPYQQGFSHKACRIDALARIVPSALMYKRTLHLLFEDCSILSLTPPFLSDWQPWSRDGSYATEYRLQKFLDGVIWSTQSCPGVQLRWGTKIQQCIEIVLAELCQHPFQAVLTLAEAGSPVVFGAKPTNGSHSTEPLPPLLWVLGGVRDMSEEEDEAISKACGVLQIPRHPVSLGHVSELTSKCIKTVENAGRLGLLDGMISRCTAQVFEPPPSTEKRRTQRAPLHIVFELSETLEDFAKRPEAACLLVDVFRGSHSSYETATLSVLDSSGFELKLRKIELDLILRQVDALENITHSMSKKRPMDLAQVLAKEQEALQGSSRAKRFVVLHVDDDAPLLKVVQPSDSSRSSHTAVAVVLTCPGSTKSPGRREATAMSLSTAAETVAVASVGGDFGALGFLCMLHNEDMLIPAIRVSTRGPQKPKVSGQEDARIPACSSDEDVRAVSVPVCGDFRRGICNRGNSCKYLHEQARSPAVEARPTSSASSSTRTQTNGTLPKPALAKSLPAHSPAAQALQAQAQALQAYSQSAKAAQEKAEMMSDVDVCWVDDGHGGMIQQVDAWESTISKKKDKRKGRDAVVEEDDILDPQYETGSVFKDSGAHAKTVVEKVVSTAKTGKSKAAAKKAAVPSQAVGQKFTISSQAVGQKFTVPSQAVGHNFIAPKVHDVNAFDDEDECWEPPEGICSHAAAKVQAKAKAANKIPAKANNGRSDDVPPPPAPPPAPPGPPPITKKQAPGSSFAALAAAEDSEEDEDEGAWGDWGDEGLQSEVAFPSGPNCLDGYWDTPFAACSIQGTSILWSDGSKWNILPKTGTVVSFLVKLENQALEARLTRPDLLLWSDGDIWSRLSYAGHQAPRSHMEVSGDQPPPPALQANSSSRTAATGAGRFGLLRSENSADSRSESDDDAGYH